MTTHFGMHVRGRRGSENATSDQSTLDAEERDADAVDEESEWVTLPDGSEARLVLPPADDLITYLGAVSGEDDDQDE
ncbi:hypothetical protein ACH4U6_24135 [Streptomyces netropsis]|uniref:hypothetical protein n=1 Tax=Streptomyces netropsis TaxID=55404 RepID=UPI0037BB201F